MNNQPKKNRPTKDKSVCLRGHFTMQGRAERFLAELLRKNAFSLMNLLQICRIIIRSAGMLAILENDKGKVAGRDETKQINNYRWENSIRR